MGAPRTAGPGVRELMAEAKGGAFEGGSDYLLKRRRDAFDNTSKVRRRTEGYRSAAAFCVS